MFEVRELRGEEAKVYEDILIERCLWLHERGMGMWRPEKLGIDALMAAYDDPSFFGAFEGDACVGGFTLVGTDERYWPGRPEGEAFYFHKFVVGSAHSGKGYGGMILEWAKDYCRSEGRPWIRLDYQKERAYLRRLYQGHGFKDSGELPREGGGILVLAEYAL